MCLLFLSFVFSLFVSLIPLGLGKPQGNVQSFCPHIFRYETIAYEGDGDWVFPTENHRWRGVISVTPPSLPIVLKVKLLVPALLPSKFSGRIALAKDRNEVVSQFQNGNLDKIIYYIYFPSRVPIPELLLIQVNSKIICSRTPLPHRVRTILTLEHSLIPIANNNVTFRDGVGVPKLWNHQVLDSEKTLSEVNVCGKGIFKKSFNSIKPSISIGDWPWMVPLFQKTELGLQFFCSSTLVSYKLVVTAAHCLRLTNMTVDEKDVVAYVGRFDITNWTEENVQPRELSDMFIHPDYDPENLRSDLAVLKFSKPVTPAPNVAPACLWQGDNNLDAIVGLNGVVFGWGTDGSEKKVTPTPRLAVMPIVSQEICLRSKMEFLFLTTNRTLCAGFRNGTGPCSGDSGGGLLIARKGSDGKFHWFLRGVVSISLVQDGQIMCNVHEYTVFTDVAKYQKWIAELLVEKKEK